MLVYAGGGVNKRYSALSFFSFFLFFLFFFFFLLLLLLLLLLYPIVMKNTRRSDGKYRFLKRIIMWS